MIEPRQNIRTFMELTLSQEGMRVFSAVNLASALLQLRVLHPDLIIFGSDGNDEEREGGVAQIRALSPSPLLVLGDEMRLSDPEVFPCSPDAGQLCAKVAALLDRKRCLGSP